MTHNTNTDNENENETGEQTNDVLRAEKTNVDVRVELQGDVMTFVFTSEDHVDSFKVGVAGGQHRAENFIEAWKEDAE